MIGWFALGIGITSFFAGDQITCRSRGIALVEHFRCQQFQRSTVDTRFTGQEALQGVIRLFDHLSLSQRVRAGEETNLAAVRRSGVENDFPSDRSGVGIPVGRISEVADLLQIFHASQVGIHLPGVTKEVGKEIGDVARPVDDVVEDDVQVDGQHRRLNAEFPKADVRILEETQIDALIRRQLLHFVSTIEIRQRSQQSI